MVGDRRPYPVLLLVPNPVKLEEWAREQGLTSRGEELVREERVRAKLEEESLGNLDGFARFEQPKKIALLFTEFTVEDGVLTPTQKVKRRVVEERFDDVIRGLYENDSVVAE